MSFGQERRELKRQRRRINQQIGNLRAARQPIPDSLIRQRDKITVAIQEVHKQTFGWRAVAKLRKHSPKRHSFYKTPEWKALRYATLVKYGARCQCCGNTAENGARINVDHVQPISKAWDMRLDPSNLQVLCGSCNQGKGGRDTTDWRPSVGSESEIMALRMGEDWAQNYGA